MKYMITWKVAPANYKAALKRFIKNGAPLPKGMKSLGRWHTAGSTPGLPPRRRNPRPPSRRTTLNGPTF